jgi:flagellum-specific peptidoglycan hydrolase FlgJ
VTNAYFLKSITADAMRLAADGVPIHPQATAAHAANESAYGRSGLATKANNLWGVKGTGAHTPFWQGDVVVMPTWEVVAGQNVTVDAPFRKYRSVGDAIGDYGALIARLYPNAVEGKDAPLPFLAGLFLTGPRRWATDPAAFDKCARILASNHDALYPPEEGVWGEARTVVLHGLRLAERWQALTRGPAVLRGRYVWRARGDKLDLRKAD